MSTRAADFALEILAEKLQSDTKLGQNEFESCMQRGIEQELGTPEVVVTRFKCARHHLYMRHVAQGAQGAMPRTAH